MKTFKRPHITLGIDPGARGAIALIRDAMTAFEFLPPLTWSLKDMTAKEIYRVIDGARFSAGGGGYISAYIEELHAMKTSYKANWTLGMSYGELSAFLIAANVPFHRVKPKVWQAEFGLARKNPNETDGQKKKRHRAVAQELFPEIKVTNDNVDALLIAEYGWRMKDGRESD